MDALFIVGNLGQSRQVGVALHIIFVAMAFPASAGDIQRVDRRAGVGDQLDIVNAVAVDAGGHAAVALRCGAPIHVRESVLSEAVINKGELENILPLDHYF